MDPCVDTVIEDPRWDALGLTELAETAVQAAFAELRLAPAGFGLCVMGCDDARIMTLNSDFRGKPSPTNVLSWPSEDRAADVGCVPDLPQPGDPDDPEHLGDIAISYDTCGAEALSAAKPLNDHVTHLIVHGFLHLLGYDHIDDADATVMEATEVRILARLGLSDPY
ncbi:MAG: rRNA maturation RNase YbeY [Cypionkella sp.]